MKNLFKPSFLVLLLALSLATPTWAYSEIPLKGTPERMSEEDAKKLINRLEEIKTMDPASMSRKEKRELRREVKSINHKLETNNNGVYLSVGAIIVIILLLILLL